MNRKYQLPIKVISVIFLITVAYYFDDPESLAADASLRVVDGDSLEIQGRKVRLIGIDAPEYKQTCKDEKGKNYGCGLKAAKHLSWLLKKHKAQCIVEGEDQYRRALAVCKGDGTSINAMMVRDGWAVIYHNQYEDYSAQQRKAQQARVGLWAGSFTTPQQWKKQHSR